MPRKAKLGFCLLVGLMLATVLPSVAAANHEDDPTEGFGGVQPHVAQAGHEIQDTFGVPYVGGYRAGDPQDHGKGLALDFMVYDDAALGDAVSNHILANWEHYNVSYIIWQQRINFGSGWQPMEDRGSPTQNHFDHVHVSFNPQSSTAIDPPVEDPAMEDPSRGGPSPVEEEPVTEDDIVQSPESEEPSVGAPAPVEEVPAAEDDVAQPQSASQPAGTSQPGSIGQSGSVKQSGGAGQPGGVGQVGGILRDVNEDLPFPIF